MKALILTGGKSSRMGTDKSQIKIGNVTLLERTISLLEDKVDETYLSVAHNDESSQILPTIKDLEPSPGPLGGLQAAFANDATSSWILLACDLPRVKEKHIKELIENHQAEFDVTCFLNPLDQHPEPLCAIYSPSASAKLDQVIQENRRCARRFLRALKRIELTPADPQALLNLNRPEHLAELAHLYQYGAMEKTVTVEYFAKLSAEAGMESEEVATTAATLTGLWEECRLRHHFSLDLPHIKPALNHEFSSWETPLETGQHIAFMPPFAGG